ncbi:serine/threonine-protein kinase PBL34-like [Rhodamnia argentea]|uniref:Serine/threonine-protein kinase PBL34-like n=1 Tax=Rhodamnia argentea TaxID=178133 RepID=A0ABM3HGD8_9MYRT|nr:serine/threonine-protein kinase PBL34-like [Rhodamnia argentea]
MPSFLFQELEDFFPREMTHVIPQTHFATKTMGTYGYAAPEYVATGRLAAKGDVYGFGVVLLENLTGLRVKDQSRPSGQHDLVEWARPSLTKKRELRRLIDPWLEGRYSLKGARFASQLVARCVSHDPILCPQMSEVVEVLKGLQDFQIRQTSSEIVRTRQGSSSGGMASQFKPR